MASATAGLVLLSRNTTNDAPPSVPVLASDVEVDSKVDTVLSEASSVREFRWALALDYVSSFTHACRLARSDTHTFACPYGRYRVSLSSFTGLGLAMMRETPEVLRDQERAIAETSPILQANAPQKAHPVGRVEPLGAGRDIHSRSSGTL